jgi:hypothetical protein
MKLFTFAVGVGVLFLAASSSVWAGCIGPTIMGKCEGAEVPWDTHPFGQKHPNPPPGFYWDWRGTEDYRQRPQDFDPFTGRDPHDSHWHDPAPQHPSWWK